MATAKPAAHPKVAPIEAKPLSRSAKQKLLRTASMLDIGYQDWEFQEIETVDSDIDVAIYKNPKTGKMVMLAIDPDDQEVIFYKKVDAPFEPVQLLPEAVVPVEKASDTETTQIEELILPGYYHPMAATLLSMSEEKQKQWWKDQKLWVPYDGDNYTLGKVIGFQKTDTGHIGAIAADRHNTRILYGISFKNGTPFILGRPKPRKTAG